LAKDNIAWLITASGTAHSCLVDIFYHSMRREVGPGVHFKPPFWQKGRS